MKRIFILVLASCLSTYITAQKYLKGNNCYLAHIDRGNIIYLNGSKMVLQLKWTFPLFNNLWFTNALNDVIDNATSNRLESGELTDLGLFICNHEKEFMQIIPFAIIYNPL